MQADIVANNAVTIGILILGLLGGPALAQPPENQKTRASIQPALKQSSGDPAGGYYVEFRAALIGTYGHSYAVYGSNGSRPKYADRHPMGGYAGMALGHVVPVPANTEWNPDVLNLSVTSSYRRTLTAAQYHKLVAKVRDLQASPGYWNAMTSNCNHYIDELAQAVGMRIPNTFQVSYTFVPALRSLNEREAPSTTSHKPGLAAQAPGS